MTIKRQPREDDEDGNEVDDEDDEDEDKAEVTEDVEAKDGGKRAKSSLTPPTLSLPLTTSYSTARSLPNRQDRDVPGSDKPESLS